MMKLMLLYKDHNRLVLT